MISGQRMWTIAINTVREALRNRVLYVLVAFALVMIAAGLVLSTLSYVERDRILQDLGLSSLRLFGALIAIFVGVGLIHKEIDRRTIYTILSKPVSRTEFLLGKYLGLVLTLWLQVAVMGIGFAAVSLVADAPLDGGHAAAVGLAAVELTVVVAIVTLFSAFTTPLLASLYTSGLYLVGHLTRDLRELGGASDSEMFRSATIWLHRILPDLESFNLTIPAVIQQPISGAEIGFPILYATGYVAILLMMAAWILERRDFR